MEAVHETTRWTGVDHQQPNHDYLLDGDKIVAYRPWGTAEIRVLRSGIKIDRRGRKFVKLDPNPFAEQEQHPDPVILSVPGSKGAVYRVNTQTATCTCPGFTFRGSCKHIKELALEDY
jgi:Uncharacterized conserved protein